VPDPEHDRVLGTLREDFRLAKKVFDETSQQFDEIYMHASPDSGKRIKIVSRQLDSARERYMKAVTRLNLFVTHGRVPDDLKESREP
jgi:hypothetical protein